MTIQDPNLAASLAALSTPQPLHGPDGSFLGRYLPAVPGMSVPESGLTDAELLNILSEPDGWVSADEVTRRLRDLRSQS